jgi:peptidoglycan/xylan/chitin deacetylase (PgdA/CDA1 family)
MGAACSPTLSEYDQIYSHAGDGRIVCSFDIDNKNEVSTDAIATGLDRASVEQEIVHLYSHKPAGTVDVSTIEEVIAAAADRDLPFVTYEDIATAQKGDDLYGLAFSFDDHDIVGWHPLIPLFARYGARVTFNISSFHTLSEDELVMLKDLQDAGHAIEYHSTNHEDAAALIADLGPEGYDETDIEPDLALMRAAGYDPKAFAYPFGSRSKASDELLLGIFPVLRASSFNCPR